MKRTSFRRVAAPALATAALVTLAACGGGNETGANELEGDAGEASVYEGLTGTLTGGGASSQNSAQQAWVAGFGTVAPEVTVEYAPEGSGAGRENFLTGGYKFAGTDSYLKDEEIAAATETCQNTTPIQIPNYVSPIAIIFNVEGVTDLQLSPATIANIFNGTITKWNDPAIVADNEGNAGAANLPDTDIRAVHRSDESGTTGNFTDYLGAIVPDEWTVGSIETWPKEFGGEGAKGTDGVVKSVTDGEKNAIGYADASQAGSLGQAKVKVGDDFVGPSAEAAAKILDVSPPAASASDNALVFDLDHTTAEAGAYPIVLVSYLLACESYEDAEVGKLVKGYLTYILSEQGQTIGSDEAGSAPLSPTLSEKAKAIVEKIS